MTSSAPIDPFPLILGAEAFAAIPGGLNRYVDDLLIALSADGGPELRAVVVGPAQGSASCVEAVSDVRSPLRERLVSFGRRADQLVPPADVVDAHFALYGAAALMFRRVRARPLVVHFHGPWADEGVAAGVGGVVRRRAKLAVERIVYRRAVAVVTLSSSFRRLVIERYGVSPWVVRVIPPAVDLDRFDIGRQDEARALLGLPQTGVVIASVRRLVPRMGLHVLIEAWAKLSDVVPGVLVIAGEGPSHRELREAARRFGVDERIRFVGRLDDDELVALYRAADVVAVPSICLEGFGLVVLEALACGTPVVASDTGGLRDALRGVDAASDSSLFSTPGDAEELSRSIRTVLTERRPDSTECRVQASRFSYEALGRAHRSLYREVVRGAPTRRRVVYVTHTAQPSGAELAMVRLIRSLDDSVEAHVMLGEDGPLCAELERHGISYEVLASSRAARHLRRADVGRLRSAQIIAAGGAAADCVRLGRRLRKHRPDLVHASSLKALVVAGLASRAVGIPVVWHLHDRIATDHLPAAAVRFVRLLARFVPCGVVGNSEATLASLPSSRGPRGVVGNPVFSADVIAPADDAPRPFTVGVIGRLAEWKGQLVAVEAFASAFPTGPARLRIVGAALFGEVDYEQALLDAVAASGVSDRIDMVGHQRNIAPELASLDVVVHASLLPEPFGQVIVEAQAAGVAVIAADGGGVRELVDDGLSGLLHRPGDVAQLAELLRRVAEDSSLRKRLAENGVSSAQQFASELIADKMSAFYDDVAQSAVEDR